MDVPNLTPEQYRSLTRMVYGHEIWLDSVKRENGKIHLEGKYGHKLVADGLMPEVYTGLVIYDGNGRIHPNESVKPAENWYDVEFDDTGSDIYTVYFDSATNWIVNDEGWSLGVKRDFKNVKQSQAYNLYAKKIISKTDDPGQVVHGTLEIMPDCAHLHVGKEIKLTVLYEGKPLAGSKFLVYCKKTEKITEMKTDANGQVCYMVDAEGDHMFLSNHVDADKFVEDEFDETVYKNILIMETE